ncbi:Protein kinase superfamily protein [Arabidopsis thaliana]|nr:Protein kinase superfamily protein [Arabidopsis thaliana]AEE35211.1 Protein kinase superfamily protein [Arabidopsis thaliana]|eukprot:NP_974124.1 Protein kinase superfamily protein [Arabidopsis thaliana]
MGCICATARSPSAAVTDKDLLDSSKSILQLLPHHPPSSSSSSKKEGSFTRTTSSASITIVANGYPVARRPSTSSDRNSTKPVVVVGAPTRNPTRRVTAIPVAQPAQQQPARVISNKTELPAAEWPSWLASVAGEAIKGWVPRCAESFEKLDKIGQGTYSSVYKARDLETGKIVAMKKVRFVNMDPESVRFMAREILILRKLDHPNVMKLEGLVTSRLSGSLYLVFEYMEHDLAGLAATPGIKFSEPQIKCYMQQLFRGLEHCHRRGILHRDIKGSNLLINNEGVLKIGDFGLANFYRGDGDLQLTSRVVTLWYRAPELLLGATEYGPAIDLWSAGCILTELFAGKPIMPGRTEVEQMHKIFKLCGSPSEDYWRRATLPLATSFKPSHPYKPVLAETFNHFPSSALMLINKLLAIEPEKRGSAASTLRSEFFTTEPLPANPSNLPRYPPSKELDAKLRNEEARK